MSIDLIILLCLSLHQKVMFPQLLVKIVLAVDSEFSYEFENKLIYVSEKFLRV